MEYFNWLEQEAEEQRREERRELVQRFVPVDDHETDSDDGREA